MFLTLNLLLIPRYTMLISPTHFTMHLLQNTARSATNRINDSVVSVYSLIPQIDNL